jgi:hypothetical protein
MGKRVLGWEWVVAADCWIGWFGLGSWVLGLGSSGFGLGLCALALVIGFLNSTCVGFNTVWVFVGALLLNAFR